MLNDDDIILVLTLLPKSTKSMQRSFYSHYSQWNKNMVTGATYHEIHSNLRENIKK
jgi:hypothetical protein